MNIIINNLKSGDKQHHFSEKNLPALIHYKCKEWWSHYSMVLIANLVLQWSKAIILTWYPEAKEQFYKDTKKIAKNIAVIKNKKDLIKNKEKQIIVINADDEKLCLETIKYLKDIDDRIIFIKNIDIFHKRLLNESSKYNKLILSWEIDTCPAKEKILKTSFNSILLFSQPKIKLPYKFIPIAPFTWYIWSKNKKWYIQSAK